MANRREGGGFVGMDPEKQREIAQRGGRAAHEKGTAHEFTADEARVAGRKGGLAVSRDRKYMSRIGRLGGLRSRLGPKKASVDQSVPGAQEIPNGQDPGGENRLT